MAYKPYLTVSSGVAMVGVETHCEELYPRLVQYGYDITIVRRTCYITENIRINNYKGIKILYWNYKSKAADVCTIEALKNNNINIAQ